MYKFFSFLLVSIMILGSSTAQNFNIKNNPSYSSRNAAALDTLRILGVMVSFQADRDETTFGTGKFGSIYSADYGNSIIDPLPHDRAYFAAHLEFIKNYFTKVSGGNLIIEYDVLPDTFSLPQVMRSYSPGINSDDFTPIAQLASKAWQTADSLYPSFNFGRYNLFAVFHAGVGRDISLPGSIGNERDIPSIYIGENSPQKISVPVSDGSFVINNSMIIPETESRELTAVDGSKVLFEISINGLLAASVASHLGLPDLFNTETGLSAIGRFGLMDGQSIFAYNGLFPPEPSAWEKIKLGWAEPVTLNLVSSNVNLTARLSASVADTVILKIPVNSSEYFLLENRNRDARNDGARITFLNNGITNTRIFTKDGTGFSSIDIDSLEGIITDIDEFDWALPGNGIVIWHIDENIINAKITENKINNDKNHRGVDVEEADGVQDIGEQFKTLLGDIVIGEGTQEDFWYRDNPAELYNGIFSKDSRPNSNSYSGANSLITLSNFSGISNKMSFTVSHGDSVVKPIFTSSLNIHGRIKGLTNSSSESNLSFDIISDSAFYRVSEDTIELIDDNFSSFKTASFELNGNIYSAGANGNQFKIYSNANKEALIYNLPSGENASTEPVVNKVTDDTYEIIIGTFDGKVIVSTLILPDITQQVFTLTSKNVQQIAADRNLRFSITEDVLYQADSSLDFIPSIADINDILLTKDKEGNYLIIILYHHNKLKLITYKKEIIELTLPQSDSVVSLSMGDLKNDGNNYILFTSGNKLEAINLNGFSAENFPFIDPLGIGFTGAPLTGDFEGDNKSEVIAYTKDGRIFAIDGATGKIVPGFPLSMGAELGAVPVLFNYQGKASLAAIDVKNNFNAWTIGSTAGKLYWSEKNGNNFNSSFVAAASNLNIVNDFFPSNRAYNYPNPAYGGETRIRYYVSEDSRINIKIFDLAGDFVAELNSMARGGFDNETSWNVNEIQSGVYLARIEAAGLSGKIQTNIIKIAVIK